MGRTKTAQSIGYRDSINIEEKAGKYRLNISRKYSRLHFGVDQKRVYTRLSVSPENLAALENTATKIHLDFLANNFDTSLVKYGLAQPELTIVESKPKSEPTLMEIWNMWLEQGELIWEVKTKAKLKAFNNHVQKIPSDLLSLDKATEVRDFLLKNCPTYTAKEILVRVNAAAKDALKKGLIIRNPFEGLASEIQIQPKSEEEIVDPFTVQERDLIISVYEKHKHYKKYASLVKAMLWTGARPSELIGLRWESVSNNFDLIVFKEAIVYDAGRKVRKDSTKTKKIRRFPVCQQKLKNLLMELKPESTQPDDLVFHRGDGQPIDYGQFSRSWRGGDNGSKKYHGVVAELVTTGQLSHYRSPYQCRHTFATLAIENGMQLHDIARLLGNTAKVCEERYIKSRRNLFIPEF